DLYYRLNVITIIVPPLRERREDVPVLAHHFLRVYAAKNNRRLEGFNEEALARLEGHSWPGNVRELENVVERAVVLARGALIEVSDFPESVAGVMPGPDWVKTIPIGTPLAEVELRLLEVTLRHTKGNQTLAAKLLGIDPKTVYRKLKQRESEESPVADSGELNGAAGNDT
ncbi:MAG: sigma-54-dependent Fis family transcriptional regulator, partial [Candidatus Rokubacteria bacterium]|nr:sigma-54-dependent Fis family transcriptional regulator [Candidatus Rokubacteria bacterium]